MFLEHRTDLLAPLLRAALDAVNAAATPGQPALSIRRGETGAPFVGEAQILRFVSGSAGAGSAGGGMRDALSLLDQILSACGDTPSDAAVADALGAIDRTLVHGFAQALVTRDAKAVLVNVEEVWNRGLDLRRVAEELALTLRHLVVAKATGAGPEELADSDRQALVALSREADAAQLTRLFDIVHGSIWEIARAAQPRLALEVTLLKGIQLAPSGSLPDLIARVERLAGPVPRAAAGAPGGGSSPTTFRA
jgi:DNA polymerase-3 subunit gamma/tau